MDQMLPQLLQVGIAGVMLCWFMARVERRLDAVARATDRSTRALLLLVVSLPTSTESAQRAARKIQREIASSDESIESEESP